MKIPLSFTHLVALTGLLFTAALSSQATAATLLRLPPSACNASALYTDGFETPISGAPSLPSNGFGGAFPGEQTRTVFVAPLGLRTYHIRLPPEYTPARAYPMLFVLHGQPPGPSFSDEYARGVRASWAAVADAQGFIVVAPVATGPSSGSWNPPNDDAMLDAIRADMELFYNVERTRRYLWGFSAGGHYGHGYALDRANTLAAYAVNAGVLEGYAGANAPALASRPLPVSIRVGSADSPGLLAAARRDPPRFSSSGWVNADTLRYTEFPGGHTYAAADLQAAWGFVCGFGVAP